MESYNIVSTPMDLMEDGLQLQTNMGEEFVDQYEYQRLVGSFIFLTHIHLEISFVVKCVSIYTPQKAPMDEAKRILRYI